MAQGENRYDFYYGYGGPGDTNHAGYKPAYMSAGRPRAFAGAMQGDGTYGRGAPVGSAGSVYGGPTQAGSMVPHVGSFGLQPQAQQTSAAPMMQGGSPSLIPAAWSAAGGAAPMSGNWSPGVSGAPAPQPMQANAQAAPMQAGAGMRSFTPPGGQTVNYQSNSNNPWYNLQQYGLAKQAMGQPQQAAPPPSMPQGPQVQAAWGGGASSMGQTQSAGNPVLAALNRTR